MSLEKIETTLTNTKSELERLTTHFTEQSNALSSKIDSFLNTVKVEKEQLKKKREQREELSQKKSNLENELASLNSQIEELERQIKDLEKSIQNKKENIQNLEMELDKLRRQKIELKSQLASLQTNLENTNKELETTERELAMEEKRHEEEIGTLKRQAEELKEKNNLMEKQFKAIKYLLSINYIQVPAYSIVQTLKQPGVNNYKILESTARIDPNVVKETIEDLANLEIISYDRSTGEIKILKELDV